MTKFSACNCKHVSQAHRSLCRALIRYLCSQDLSVMNSIDPPYPDVLEKSLFPWFPCFFFKLIIFCLHFKCYPPSQYSFQEPSTSSPSSLPLKRCSHTHTHTYTTYHTHIYRHIHTHTSQTHTTHMHIDTYIHTYIHRHVYTYTYHNHVHTHTLHTERHTYLMYKNKCKNKITIRNRKISHKQKSAKSKFGHFKNELY